jgi:hypothetical protein
VEAAVEEKLALGAGLLAFDFSPEASSETFRHIKWITEKREAKAKSQ